MKSTALKYLYITGAGFSGSTLLAFLLNAHPEMASIGEQRRLKGRNRVAASICSCGLPILNCPFFAAVERRVLEQGSSFNFNDWYAPFQYRSRFMRGLLEVSLPSKSMERIRDSLVTVWPGNAEAVRAMAPRVYDVASAVLKITGKGVFVDTDKQPIRIKFLRKIPELDLRVIHLIRDVRGSVASFIRKPWRGVWPKWPVRSLDVAEGAVWWRSVNMNSERVLTDFPAGPLAQAPLRGTVF